MNRELPKPPRDVVLQAPEDWSCAVRSLWAAIWIMNEMRTWDINTIGHQLKYEDVRDMMLRRNLVTKQLGLMDGSGAALAEFVTEFTTKRAYNLNPVTRDQVWNLAGKDLVLIGGRNWGPAGHWALVYGREDDGTLVIANPAPGYQLGPTPIFDSIRDSWIHSAWSAVVIEPGTIPNVVVPPAPCEERVRFLESQLQNREDTIADLATRLGEAANFDGSVRKGLQGVVNFLESIATKKENTK